MRVRDRKNLTIYPAIDLKGGRCVRLLHGKMDDATVYNDDPAAQAAAFARDGYGQLHIVDLDGAFSGKSENQDAVRAILGATHAWRQLGGGVRDMAALEGWLAAGIDRVILGTAAVRQPDFVKAAARAYPGKVAVGVDAVDGLVKTDGWAGHTRHTAADIGKRYEDQGVSALIYTDVGRDGALSGVNVEATAALANAVAIPVIASGGVAGVDDIKRLVAVDAQIEGVIVGRAIYEGRFAAPEALAAAQR